MPIVYRSTKGSPLTISEADGNFSYISEQLGQKVDVSAYTAEDVLAKLLTVTGEGSGLDAELLGGMLPESTNTSESIVARDSSGNFAAGTITANLIGNVTGNITGNVTGTATGVSGVVGVTNGGTGTTTISGIKSLLSLGTLSSQNSNDVNITGGVISLTTPLSIASGGTGSTTKENARLNLGLVIGSDVQPQNSTLTGLSALSDGVFGLYVRTGNASSVIRTLSVGSGISIANADGVSGNPTISLAENVSLTGIPTAPNPTTGTNNNQISTTSFVASSVSTAVNNLTTYINNEVNTLTNEVISSNQIKAKLYFQYTIYNNAATITILNSSGVASVSYIGSTVGTFNKTGYQVFRVNLNNGVFSNGNYIVAGSVSQIDDEMAISSVSSTQFTVTIYTTGNGGTCRLLMVD